MFIYLVSYFKSHTLNEFSLFKYLLFCKLDASGIRHGELFMNNVKCFVKYVYDCKSVLNLFCFYKPICGLNINIKLIDYPLDSVLGVIHWHL